MLGGKTFGKEFPPEKEILCYYIEVERTQSVEDKKETTC